MNMLSCKESTHLISEAQDRSLSFTEKTALETHMLICVGCRRYREQMNFLRTLCQQHPAHPHPHPDPEQKP
jgi:hypothetical protein